MTAGVVQIAPRRASDHIERHLESMRQRGLSESTIRHRRYDLRRVQAFLGREDLLTATVEEMEAWRASLALTQTKAGSTHRNVSYVMSFYRWAHSRGLVDADPTAALLLPKLPRRLPRPICEDRLGVVLGQAPSRVLPWMILAAYAGLRACEVASLTCEDVVTAATVPHLRIVGKGDKERAVPLSAVVLDHLAPIVAAGGRFAFPRGDGLGGHVPAAQVSRLTNDVLHGLGYRDTFHSLRHRFATMIYQQTKDLRLVQELMGHVDPGTTAVYAALDPLAAAAAVGALGGAIQGRPEPVMRVAEPVAAPPPRPRVPEQPTRPARLVYLPAPWGEAKPPSAREVSILLLMADSHSNVEIARVLGISALTVKSHLARMARKLGTSHRAGMVAVAFRTGLIT